MNIYYYSSVQVKNITLNELPQGDVLIKFFYYAINYKDSLVSITNGKMVTTYPFIPGIDLAGVVVSSQDPQFREGDEIISTSYEIKVSHYGYCEYANIPGDWIVPLPKNLTLVESMILGTAGITAALSTQRLPCHWNYWWGRKFSCFDTFEKRIRSVASYG